MSLDTGERDTGELATDEYYAAGEAAALGMDNRGPIRFTDDGSLHPDILEAYWAHGFYVFENVVDAAELAELRSDIDQLLERAPYPTKRSTTDRHGRPASRARLRDQPVAHDKTTQRPLGRQAGLERPSSSEDARAGARRRCPRRRAVSRQRLPRNQ